MKQALHVLAVDCHRETALVMRFGGRWLLPILSVPERARAGPLVMKWARERSVRCEFVGQWLGRAAPGFGAVDWLAVLRTRTATALDPPSTLIWMPIDALRASECCLAYQQWAIANAGTAGLPVVPGPFGSLTWLDELREWLARVALPSGTGGLEQIAAHRATASEVVLELRTVAGTYFVKGLSASRTREAAITIELSKIAPDCFPRTHALDRRSDGSSWWLMEGCHGSTLEAQRSAGGVTRAAAALARVQQRSAAALAYGNFLPEIDVHRLAKWATDFLPEETDLGPSPRVWFRDRCAQVARAELPGSWVATDLDPGNVLLDGAAVRFIDLDGSMLGPAPIAAAVFGRRVERGGIAAAHDVCAAYERGWRPPLEIGGRWRDVEVVSELLEAHLAWERVAAKTRAGEIYDLLELARAAVAHRLAAVLRSGFADSRQRIGRTAVPSAISRSDNAG